MADCTYWRDGTRDLPGGRYGPGRPAIVVRVSKRRSVRFADMKRLRRFARGEENCWKLLLEKELPLRRRLPRHRNLDSPCWGLCFAPRFLGCGCRGAWDLGG